MIFALQGREQNLLEGVIVASLTILFAVSMFSLHYSASIRFPVVRHLAVLFFLAMICTIGIELWKVYVLKTPWYSLKETLPLELWHLLTLGAKKSSGLMRRVWRASEIWLIEGNDWEGFRKKFKALLIDYIIKQLQGIEVIKSYL